MKIQGLIVLIAGVMSVSANAQDFKCKDNFKALEVSVKAKEYTMATSTLKGMLENCPKYDAKLYTLGETVAVYNLETSRTEADTKTLSDNLIALYDGWEKNFPGTGGVQKKALFLHEKQLATDDEVLKMLDAAFTARKASFTDYNSLELYYNLYLAQYVAGKKGITEDQFVQKFGDMVGQTVAAKSQWQDNRAALLTKKQTQALTDDETQYLADAPLNISALEAVSENMVNQSLKHAGCTKLDAYYTALYEKNKDNTAWLSGMVTVLSTAKCNNSATLYTGAEALYAQKPDAYTALLLGNLTLKKNNVKQAATYFEKAAGFEADSLKKSEVYLTVANTYMSIDKAAAKANAIKAAAYNPKNGKPYLMLAEMYAAAPSQKDCALNDFDKKAIYWLVIETTKKAQVADPKYKPTVEGLLKRYNGKTPTKQDAKAVGKRKGDAIALGCWINETVTVPKL
jgi:hypothetical protein